VAALKGCEGKKAVIYVTCNGQFGEALPLLKKALEARRVQVLAEIGFAKKDVGDMNRKNELIGHIVSAYNA